MRSQVKVVGRDAAKPANCADRQAGRQLVALRLGEKEPFVRARGDPTADSSNRAQLDRVRGGWVASGPRQPPSAPSPATEDPATPAACGRCQSPPSECSRSSTAGPLQIAPVQSARPSRSPGSLGTPVSTRELSKRTRRCSWARSISRMGRPYRVSIQLPGNRKQSASLGDIARTVAAKKYAESPARPLLTSLLAEVCATFFTSAESS